MVFKINYNGKYEDSIIIEGDTIEEIKTQAFAECDKRNWESKDCWSEQISQ